MDGKFETLIEGATYLRARDTSLQSVLNLNSRRSDVIQNKQTNKIKTNRYFETSSSKLCEKNKTARPLEFDENSRYPWFLNDHSKPFIY